MTELEAYIQREEEELRQCLDQISMIEGGKIPVPDNEGLKKLMLEKENHKKALLETHIKNMKAHLPQK